MRALSRPFKGRSSSAFSFYASLFHAMAGVMSLALCRQVVSRAPQHLESSETEANCNNLIDNFHDEEYKTKPEEEEED